MSRVPTLTQTKRPVRQDERSFNLGVTLHHFSRVNRQVELELIVLGLCDGQSVLCDHLDHDACVAALGMLSSVACKLFTALSHIQYCGRCYTKHSILH
jgi:hypothetical protein